MKSLDIKHIQGKIVGKGNQYYLHLQMITEPKINRTYGYAIDIAIPENFVKKLKQYYEKAKKCLSLASDKMDYIPIKFESWNEDNKLFITLFIENIKIKLYFKLKAIKK